MSLTFYHTRWCPRCRRADSHLSELLGAAAATGPQRLDVLRHPLAAWRAGIRMIPALSCNGETISGITLDRPTIAAFLARHRLIAASGPAD